MRKGKLLAGLLCTASLLAGSLVNVLPVMADAMRVVTLGADLSDAQKNTMLKYFKVKSDEVRIIYVTNQDERNHLGGYVPLEQIGSRTVSCAYVRPTTSGGIKVRTANLNWVTGNMIASSLSTAGVSNCEVVAACPFEVSGTGALTGVQMAYEVASGEKLDPVKKEIATEEMVVTSNLANEVGQNQATNVINQAKIEVISNNITNSEEIYNTVVTIVDQNDVQVTAADLEQVVALMEEIAAQQYDYQEMQDTLQMVGDNVSAALGNEDVNDGGEDEEEDDTLVGDAGEAWEQEAEQEDEDNILNGLDESILGDEVVISSTDDPAYSEPVTNEEAEAQQEDTWDVFPADDNANVSQITEESADAEGEWWNQYDDSLLNGSEDTLAEPEPAPAEAYEPEEEPAWQEEVVDMAPAQPEESVAEPVYQEEVPQETDTLVNFEETEGSGDDWEENESEDLFPEESEGETEIDIDDTDTSYLENAAQEKFDKALTFCQGEYEGEISSYQEALEDYDAYPEVTLDWETGHALTNKVMHAYLSILGNGAASYSPEADDEYYSPELNMIHDKLQEIFHINGTGADTEVLAGISYDDQQTLYTDTLRFFEKLYGEAEEAFQEEDEEILDMEETEGDDAEDDEDY